MKANELRIGNWVMIDPNNHPQQVVDVMCDSVNTYNVQGAHYGMVDGIPLTEEWLLKFGFEKALNGYWCDKNFMNVKFSPNIEIYLSGDDYDLAYYGIEYVHQLQNLYFALTGEELTYGGNK